LCFVIVTSFNGHCHSKEKFLGEWGPQGGWCIQDYEDKPHTVIYWAVTPPFPEQQIKKEAEPPKEEE